MSNQEQDLWILSLHGRSTQMMSVCMPRAFRAKMGHIEATNPTQGKTKRRLPDVQLVLRSSSGGFYKLEMQPLMKTDSKKVRALRRFSNSQRVSMTPSYTPSVLEERDLWMLKGFAKRDLHMIKRFAERDHPYTKRLTKRIPPTLKRLVQRSFLNAQEVCA